MLNMRRLARPTVLGPEPGRPPDQRGAAQTKAFFT